VRFTGGTMRQTLFNTGSLIVIAALLTATAPVMAAEDIALEEVVVTAERREESLQRTPI
jgi:outer membrane cobalamin receptor